MPEKPELKADTIVVQLIIMPEHWPIIRAGIEKTFPGLAIQPMPSFGEEGVENFYFSPRDTNGIVNDA